MYMTLADQGFVVGIYKTLGVKDSGHIFPISHPAERIQTVFPLALSIAISISIPLFALHLPYRFILYLLLYLHLHSHLCLHFHLLLRRSSRRTRDIA